MRILITGATGFVGTTLVPYLYDRGWEQMALLVRNPDKAHKMFLSISGLEIIDTACDWIQRIKTFNPDVVIHLATHFTTKSDSDNLTEIINTNILFTTRLLEAITHTACKCFINIGTFSEFQYGAGIFKPNNLYSASKTAVRPIIQFYQSVSGFKWINVIIYSPYGRYNPQKKILDYLVEAVGSDRSIAFSKGEQILDFIHVYDIASFFDTLLRKITTLPGDFHEFHLGSGKGYSLRDVAKIVEEVYGGKVNAEWGKLSYRENDIMHAVAPISKNASLLNWRCRLSLKEGIQILKDDMQNNAN